jgi:hypothetical protein
MKNNIKIIFISSEDPRIIKNGVTAAFNTCLRTVLELNYDIDIYIHNSKIFIDSNLQKESILDFNNINVTKYDYIFLSPINVAFKYLFSYKKVREHQVISFLSDCYSYTLFRNFNMGLKFNKFFFIYLLRFPVAFLKELYVEKESKKIALQTPRDVYLFNKLYFSRKSIFFPNSPIFKDIKRLNINNRSSIGWIVSCTDDYFPLTKWFFRNVVLDILQKNDDFKLHIHGKNNYKLRDYIEKISPNNNFNINYTEYVDEISTFYLNVKVLLSPVYKGYGLINRTIEAMYYGCIVVGDPMAFNGIKRAKNGVNCYIAKNNKDFIEKIEVIYKSGSLESISNNSHDTVKEDFDIKNNIEILRNNLN